MKLFPVVFLILLTSCNETIKYPEGGYNYVTYVSNKDTNFYYFPLKNREPKSYAFGDSYQYLLYQLFNEPNLSIKPFPKEIFRFTYKNAFEEVIIITLTEQMLTVKKGNTHDLFYLDKTRLTAIENYHLRILKKWYPIETSGKSTEIKRMLDSMINLYPQLLDSNYYHSIYEKQFVQTGKKFTYSSYKIQISYKQFYSIIKQINLSGFWKLPYQIECNEAIADGDEFTLEANTKHKYQKVTVQTCPNNKAKFTLSCQNIVHLAKMGNEIKLIW